MNLDGNERPVFKIAVVGTGYRAASHLSTIPKLSDIYKLVAVCDVIAERVEETAKEFGINAYVDVETMLQQERPNVLLIAVPPEAHHTVAELAAKYGAHILCETPISMTLPYADYMIETAKKHGVQLEIAENVWRRPEERLKRMVIEAGLIGDVKTARLWYNSGSYHGINAVRKLVGSEVRRVVGMAKVLDVGKQRRGFDIFHFGTFAPEGVEPPQRFQESSVATWEAGLLEFENGVLATYEFPITSRPMGNAWDIHGANGYISGNSVVIQTPEQRALRIIVESEMIDGISAPARARLYDGDKPLSDIVWENPLVHYKPENSDEVARIDQLVSIYRAAVDGTPPSYDGEQGKKDIEVLVAVRESARLGNVPVDLPLLHVTGYEEHLQAM